MLLLNYFTLFFLIRTVQWTNAAYLRYYRSSLEDYQETELQNPLPLLKWIDCSKPLLFFAFGFNGNPDKDDVKIITNAFINTNDTNFILVNWELEAKNYLFDSVLAHALTATPNSISVGIEFGMSLLQLSTSLDMSRVQLVGHSLGAHLVGYAGLFARKRGVVIGRITGLDPSSYNYEGYVHSEGLDSSSADFVAIWHTDPGNYGIAQPLGDVDVWFNCKDSVQPGCPKDGYLYKYNDTRASCSHRRAAFYFADAVSSPESFIAVRALNCESWEMGDTSNPIRRENNILYINEKISTGARGCYYLSTNSQQPYGRGLDGIRSS